MKSFENLRAALDAQRAKTQQTIDNFNKAALKHEPMPVGSVTVHASPRRQFLTGAEVARAQPID